MHALLSRGDPSEKTILLGPLDTFPAAPDELTTDLRQALVRLESGLPVRVAGASVVRDSKRLTLEEEGFLMRPSVLLQLARMARNAAWLVRRPAFLAPVARSLLARFRGVRPLAKAGTAHVRAAGASVVACARSLDKGQRRLTISAFAAGITLASLVALVF